MDLFSQILLTTVYELDAVLGPGKIALNNQENVLISYGSPFVDRDLNKLGSFIMVGSAGIEFETAAAELLLGKLQAKGKMPF